MAALTDLYPSRVHAVHFQGRRGVARRRTELGRPRAAAGEVRMGRRKMMRRRRMPERRKRRKRRKLKRSSPLYVLWHGYGFCCRACAARILR